MPSAHSFDVYDTLLVRTRARPVDVLRAAAERAVPGSSDSPGRAELVAELSRRRRAAEFQALGRSGLDAVGLDAIYAELEEVRELGVEPEDLRRAELAIEEEELRLVHAGAELVRRARAAGRRVLFVSDMYLPPQHIRGALERFGIAEAGDPLYVSGELGVDKRQGGMFDHVLREEGLGAGELVHTGDDPVTDLAVPVRRGIAVEPLTLARLDRFERATLAQSHAPREVTAELVGCTRAARVRHAPVQGDGVHAATLGANVAGPLFASYVCWVLRSAREEGVERLYFVSRDAQVLLAIAREVAQPGDPECRYLYGSRQAWLLAGVDRVDEQALSWVLEPEPAAPRLLLARLGVSPDEVADALRSHGLGLDDKPSAEMLTRFWVLVEDIAPLILERAGRARDLAAAYFAQEGLRADGRWALVDLGWRLTAQRALRRVLAADGRDGDVLGLYLGVDRRRVPLEESGPFRAFLFEDEEPETANPPESWLWGSRSFVEQVLALADHGSCTGYRREGERIVPELRDMPPDPRRETLRATIQGAAIDCARELQRAGLLDGHLADVRAAGLLCGRLAIEQPTREEAAALAWVQVADDQSEARWREIAPPLTLADVWRHTRDKLGRPVRWDFETLSRWRDGSLAVTPRRTRILFDVLRLARLQSAQRLGGVRRSAAYRRWRRVRRRPRVR